MACKFNGCANLSLSLSEYCWNHLPDRESYRKILVESAHNEGGWRGYNLRKVDLAGFHLEKIDASKANLSQVDFKGSHLFDANLSGADLVGANLSNCELTHANLKNTDLTKANLEGARLWNADMTGANLAEADMSGADLWNTRLFGVRLWHTNFSNARFLSMRSFSHHRLIKVAKIDETGLLSAEEAYRNLKSYFLASGMYNDASWASFKEKSIERLILRKNGNLDYFPSLLMNILCGYGEKPYRIVLASFFTILIYALLYLLSNAITCSADGKYPMKAADYIYYSTITFTTVGYGDFVPKSNTLFRILAASEAFSGIFLTGLFIFTLARKYSAR